jgi:TolB-like protein/DNA-binding winged helix-turn-helix (wHTH) protein
MAGMEQESAEVPHVTGYRVDDLVIDLGQQRVTRGERDIALPRLSFDLLVALTRAAPNLVSFDQLMERVWPGLVVAPDTISQRVSLVRDALGDDPHAPRYIAGKRGRGYRMVATVSPIVKEPQSHVGVADAATGAKAAVASPPSPALDAPPASGRFSRLVVAMLIVLALGLGYVVIDRFWISKRSDVAQQMARPHDAPALVAFNPPPKSIAVLPFVNISGDEEQGYFAVGLTEELLDSLSRINELQVAARTSSFSFTGEHPDIGTVARRLNVRAVLEGSVRRSGNTVRITTQLVDGVTGFHMWSQSYDRNLENALQLQTDIATAVAGALKVTLLDDALARIEAGGTHNPAAFDAYLRASKLYWDGAGDRAIPLYTEAIRLDPNYALAYAARSIADDSASRSDALKAVALAPNLGEAHLALALVNWSSDFRFADEECHRALALAPGNARVLRDCGHWAIFMGHGDVGLRLIRRAVDLDPLNLESQSHLAEGLYYLRRPAEALAAAKNAEVLHPGSHKGWMGFVYYELGDFQSARSACENDLEGPDRLFCLAMTYDKLGRHADAEAMLRKLRATAGDRYTLRYCSIYAQWGNNAQGLDMLEKAVRLHSPGLWKLKAIPFLDPLRQEPRFQAIVQALQFPD